jgi:CubicO group peptidase (beta-lactamase class C family)
MGGGGLYSTAGDYLKFVRLFLNRGNANGNQVLQPDTVALMSRNSMGNTKVHLLKTAIPPLSNDAEFFPGMPKSWGLTFMINEEMAPTGRPAGSLAWAGLANTYFWIDQQRGVGGVYLSQVLQTFLRVPVCRRPIAPIEIERANETHSRRRVMRMSAWMP